MNANRSSDSVQNRSFCIVYPSATTGTGHITPQGTNILVDGPNNSKKTYLFDAVSSATSNQGLPWKEFFANALTAEFSAFVNGESVCLFIIGSSQMHPLGIGAPNSSLIDDFTDVVMNHIAPRMTVDSTAQTKRTVTIGVKGIVIFKEVGHDIFDKGEKEVKVMPDFQGNSGNLFATDPPLYERTCTSTPAVKTELKNALQKRDLSGERRSHSHSILTLILRQTTNDVYRPGIPVEDLISEFSFVFLGDTDVLAQSEVDFAVSREKLLQRGIRRFVQAFKYQKERTLHPDNPRINQFDFSASVLTALLHDFVGGGRRVVSLCLAPMTFDYINDKNVWRSGVIESLELCQTIRGCQSFPIVRDALHRGLYRKFIMDYAQMKKKETSEDTAELQAEIRQLRAQVKMADVQSKGGLQRETQHRTEIQEAERRSRAVAQKLKERTENYVKEKEERIKLSRAIIEMQMKMDQQGDKFSAENLSKDADNIISRKTAVDYSKALDNLSQARAVAGEARMIAEDQKNACLEELKEVNDNLKRLRQELDIAVTSKEELAVEVVSLADAKQKLEQTIVDIGAEKEIWDADKKVIVYFSDNQLKLEEYLEMKKKAEHTNADNVKLREEIIKAQSPEGFEGILRKVTGEKFELEKVIQTLQQENLNLRNRVQRTDEILEDTNVELGQKVETISNLSEQMRDMQIQYQNRLDETAQALHNQQETLANFMKEGNQEFDVDNLLDDGNQLNRDTYEEIRASVATMKLMMEEESQRLHNDNSLYRAQRMALVKSLERSYTVISMGKLLDALAEVERQEADHDELQFVKDAIDMVKSEGLDEEAELKFQKLRIEIAKRDAIIKHLQDETGLVLDDNRKLMLQIEEDQADNLAELRSRNKAMASAAEQGLIELPDLMENVDQMDRRTFKELEILRTENNRLRREVQRLETTGHTDSIEETFTLKNELEKSMDEVSMLQQQVSEFQMRAVMSEGQLEDLQDYLTDAQTKSRIREDQYKVTLKRMMDEIEDLTGERPASVASYMLRDPDEAFGDADGSQLLDDDDYDDD